MSTNNRNTPSDTPSGSPSDTPSGSPSDTLTKAQNILNYIDENKEKIPSDVYLKLCNDLISIHDTERNKWYRVYYLSPYIHTHIDFDEDNGHQRTHFLSSEVLKCSLQLSPEEYKLVISDLAVKKICTKYEIIKKIPNNESVSEGLAMIIDEPFFRKLIIIDIIPF
jgi:hypothetical protein